MPVYLSINKCILIHLTYSNCMHAAGLNTFELDNFIVPSLFFFYYFYESISKENMIIQGLNIINLGILTKDYLKTKKYMPLIIILLFSFVYISRP
jgi:hypothetical protein